MIYFLNLFGVATFAVTGTLAAECDFTLRPNSPGLALALSRWI